MHASVPPASMTSAAPDCSRARASESACEPVAQAVAGAADGPCKPARMLTWPPAMLTSMRGMK